MEQLDPDVCYRALRTRDPRFDGRFFVAVRTTGIYCRPVCPARTPLRKNVTFFGCAAAAEEAGYRPCLRCRPETAPGTPRWDGTFATVTRALRLIDRGALDRDDVGSLAADLGIGERQLRRLFAHHLGTSPLSVASSRRAHEARMLLEASDLSMLDIALASGFGSLRQFNDAIRARFHATPTQIRRARRSPAFANGVARFRLPFRPPFAWDRMLDFLASRAIDGVEQVEARRYRRVFTSGAEAGFFEASIDPRGNALRLTVAGASPRALLPLVRRVRRTFDLDADPMAIAHALEQSPLLRKSVRERPGLRIPGAWDPFEALVRGVVGQQISVAAATTMCSRLVRRWGRRVEAAPGLTHAFPTAEALARADLRQIGLTESRAGNLARLAARVAAEPEMLSPGRDLHDLVERLRGLPGVGPWTAQYVAMRGFHEPDAFPERDLGLLRGAGVAWGDLESAMNRVRPFRAYAALHLWARDASEVGHVDRAVAV